MSTPPAIARLALLLATLIGLSPSRGGAQVAGQACLEPNLVARRQQAAAMRIPLLYDGVAPLARAPTQSIMPPPELGGQGCLLLNVEFGERDGAVFPTDVGVMGMSDQALSMQMRRLVGRSRVMQSITQVIRDAVAQQLFAVRPHGGQRYMVALSLALNHPIYSARAAANAPTLAARGFPESTRMAQAGDVEVYRLGENGYHQYLAVVRTVGADEPILEYDEVQGAAPFRQWRYGRATDERFRTMIVPHLRDVGMRVAEVAIYHYARDVRIDRQPDSRFPWNVERHYRTGEPVEVPLAVERWIGRRSTAGGPYVWESIGVQPTDLNTITAIQKVQSGIAAQQQVYAANRAAMYAREAQELTARRARVVARNQERTRLITAAGLISLPAATWQKYQLGPEMRAVFDGTWRGAITEWQFGSIYSRTIRAFSNRCRRLIPEGSPRIVQKWVTRDRYGNDWRSDGSDTTFIPEAFAEPFRWWEKNDPRALPLAPPGLRAGNLGEMMSMMATLMSNPGEKMTATAMVIRVEIAMREDMAVLFADGCESPVVKQFMENMRRIALRLPTLQQERAPQSILTEAEWPMPIAKACELQNTARGSRTGRDWCPCLERQFRQVLTLGEQWMAVEDYATFFDEVDGFRLAPDGRPVWARYQPANACRK